MKRLLLLTLFFPLFSFAQDADQANADRMERLERDIQMLQRQLSRGGTPAPLTPNSDVPPENPAQMEVRFSAIETQIRELRGKIEENEFQNKKLTDMLDKLQRDMDFRFNELSNTRPAASAPAAGTIAAPAGPTPAINAMAPNAAAGKVSIAPSTGDEATVKTVTAYNKDTGAPAQPTSAGDGVLRTPQPQSNAPEDLNSFATPRDLYTYAFRLLNQTKYDAAASAFDAFTKKYPKDPLIGNAYYWQGETFYIRRDYVTAADSFRQGFESSPDGPKAPDNLLKLAMSLNALQRDKEACVVLNQITTKYKKSSDKVSDKAAQEQKRIGCQ